ncbi:uncharacterized protein (DUF983 family) [Litorimonas taeanensis]|uniref:Uncharacterized protein (DUF983 family) n=1 Tax=Litorimonas taeanensis TaxID=568099 RepID=A0A420WE24_9PROT|nr:DUF983 domain-containing protein [Litorimonas taeanensis]RKQ69267.1 uncharacterized protein (DUF983 family) [Litorimonas taeanensis]
MARRPPPVGSGLKGRCPECGEGLLFAGFLRFAHGCEACGADFRDEDAGDGPTVFVIFIVGIFIIPMALAFQLITNAPTWLTLVIWTPIIILVCLGLLRLLRGVMFNLAWTHKAREIRNNQIRQNQKQTPPQ